MLQFDLKPITRKWAVALIIINLLRIGTAFIAYFQTKYQLVSPLIPQDAIIDIIRPYMVVGLVSVIVTVIAFVFFVYSKFTFAIITCAINLVFVELYFYLNH
jgi:hypothetical protein